MKLRKSAQFKKIYKKLRKIIGNSIGLPKNPEKLKGMGVGKVVNGKYFGISTITGIFISEDSICIHVEPYSQENIEWHKDKGWIIRWPGSNYPKDVCDWHSQKIVEIKFFR